MRKFVLAGTQRAGTSLVNSTLNSHSHIRCYGEVFLYANGKGKNMPGSYRQFIDRRGWLGWALHYLHRSASIRQCLDELYSSTEYEAVGFKLMLGQVTRNPVIAEYLTDHDVRVVYVFRENVLKTHLSRGSAKERGLYISKKAVNVSTVHVETKNLLDSLQSIAGEQTRWRDIFKDLPGIQIHYEDFVRDQSSEIARIEDFLEVRHETLSTSVTKINPDDMRQYVENYDELAEYLQGTEFEVFL